MKKNIRRHGLHVLCFLIGAVLATGITAFALGNIISAEYNHELKVIYNGQELQLAAPMIAIVDSDNPRSAVNYMPIRAVLEAMGYNVGWDSEARAALVTAAGYVEDTEDAGQAEEPEDNSEPAGDLDVQLTSEQLAFLSPIEIAILALDYETAYSIAVTPDFRSFLAGLSDGGNVSYKNDNSGRWMLRYIDAENSPDRALDAGYSNCSVGVRLADGQVYWFDCFGSAGNFGSNLRVSNSAGETTRLTIFNGQTATHYDGEQG